MKVVESAWGIDIGSRSLRAIRLGLDDQEEVTALDFTVVRLPTKGERGERVVTALGQFLDKHEVGGDLVAATIPHQSGIIRFCRLPPVPDERLSDLVKYEAAHQIPAPLPDVVWDYSRILGEVIAPDAGGGEAPGMDLVSLCALKRDQFEEAMAPLLTAGLQVDLVQLRPVALTNFVWFQSTGALPVATPVILVDLRTDDTNLVVADESRITERTLAVGGRHFTDALAKQLGIPRNEAEQLKRHVPLAKSPTSLLMAMRKPITAFVRAVDQALKLHGALLDRHAVVIPVGSGVRLPSLMSALATLTKVTVQDIGCPPHLTDDLNAGQFEAQGGWAAFATATGLALQSLGFARIRTNLMPIESRPVRKGRRSGLFSWLR